MECVRTCRRETEDGYTAKANEKDYDVDRDERYVPGEGINVELRRIHKSVLRRVMQGKKEDLDWVFISAWTTRV